MGRQRLVGWVLVAFGATGVLTDAVLVLCQYFSDRAMFAGPQAPKPVDLANSIAEWEMTLIAAVALLTVALALLVAGCVAIRTASHSYQDA